MFVLPVSIMNASTRSFFNQWLLISKYGGYYASISRSASAAVDAVGFYHRRRSSQQFLRDRLRKKNMKKSEMIHLHGNCSTPKTRSIFFAFRHSNCATTSTILVKELWMSTCQINGHPAILCKEISVLCSTRRVSYKELVLTEWRHDRLCLPYRHSPVVAIYPWEEAWASAHTSVRLKRFRLNSPAYRLHRRVSTDSSPTN